MTNLKKAYGAVKEGDIATVKALLAEDNNLANSMTPFGTLLHVAASEGNTELVDLLIQYGADIHAKGGALGGSALNEAASDGKKEVLEYLLSRGAEMDVSEPERNPLFSAIHGGHVKIAELLISNGIDIAVRYTGESMQGMDALAFAQERGQLDIAALLSNR